MRLLVIAGPTAAGKSAVAVAVALSLGDCEIVSADSMQVYRGMDIGTAKPDARLRAAVPHHLLDIITQTEDFSAADYQTRARAAIKEIHGRGNLPILVGGSGLYIRAAIDKLEFEAEPPGSKRRLQLERLEKDDPEALIPILRSVDPEASAHVDLNNPRRVIRAIEAAERTGKSFSLRYAEWNRRESVYDTLMIGLRPPREELVARIEKRVDRMMADGLVDEVRSLVAGGEQISRTAAQALGYKEFIAYLRGERGIDETVDLIKTRTRQLAKRQMTWFKADPRIEWVPAGGGVDPVDEILGLVKKKRFIVG